MRTLAIAGWVATAVACAADVESVRAAAKRFAATSTNATSRTTTQELIDLKEQLRDWFDQELARTGDPDRAVANLNRLLARSDFAWELREWQSLEDRTGEVAPFQLRRFPGSGEYFAVLSSAGLVCGSDQSVYLYRRTDGWKRILAVETAQTAGLTLEPRDYVHLLLSAPGEDGRRLFAADGFHPWCTSNLSTYSVIAYVLGKEGPEVAGFAAAASWGRVSRLWLGPREVRAEYQDGWRGGDRQVTLPLRLRLRSSYAEVVQPVAYSPEDFVIAWRDRPWSDAVAWSHPARLEELARAHRESFAGHWKPMLLAALHGCPGSDLVQVRGDHGASFVTPRSPDELSEPRYYLVRRLAAHEYRLEEVRFTPHPACTKPMKLSGTGEGVR